MSTREVKTSIRELGSREVRVNQVVVVHTSNPPWPTQHFQDSQGYTEIPVQKTKQNKNSKKKKERGKGEFG